MTTAGFAGATKQRDKMCLWSTAGAPELFIRRSPIPGISYVRNFFAIQTEGRIRKVIAFASTGSCRAWRRGQRLMAAQSTVHPFTVTRSLDPGGPDRTG